MKKFVKNLRKLFTNTFNKENRWQNIAFIFGILALTYMIYTIGIDSIWDNIKRTGWMFLPILGLWGLVYLINAIAWNSIIRVNTDRPVPFKKVLKFTISGYALNYITPMGLAGGEPYRIMELKKYMSTEKATACVILYAMMHVCSHFLFWLSATALIAWLIPVPFEVSIILTLIVFSCLFFLYLFSRGYKKGLVVQLTKWFGKIPYLGKKVSHLKPDTIKRLQLIDQQIKNLHGKESVVFYFSLSLEFIARLLSCIEILLIVYAIGYQITYVNSLIVVALSSLFANIMFFFPMQLGTREGGLYLAFKTVGIMPGISIAVSMVTRIRELFWIILGVLLMKVTLFRKNEPTKDKYDPTHQRIDF